VNFLLVPRLHADDLEVLRVRVETDLDVGVGLHGFVLVPLSKREGRVVVPQLFRAVLY